MKNHASDCSIIMPVTVEQSCKWLLRNNASACWTIVSVTVEESFQPLLMNCENVGDNENVGYSIMKAIANTHGPMFM